MSRLRKRFLDCTGMTLKDCESFGEGLAEQQRDSMFQIADLQRYAESHWPDAFHQIWPVWMSPAIPDRTKAISRAYPKEEDRQIEATYTQYNQNASKPDRMKRLQAIVDAGLTSDESRDKDKEERKQNTATDDRRRWLIAWDTSYFIHRHYHSGAGVETAMQVSEWIQRTSNRLQQKGATDVVCAFEGANNFRKELTSGEDWTDKRYKEKRVKKDPELIQQIQLTQELLEKLGFCCVSIDTYEADDVLASYAVQFFGKVTIVSKDKDLYQCLLSARCNMLLNVQWTEDETYGNILPEYEYFIELPDKKLETRNLLHDTGEFSEDGKYIEGTGLTADQHCEYQIIAGDSTDSISGAIGVGKAVAKPLILEFGTADAVIQAAKDRDERLMAITHSDIKIQALIDFESRLDVTRQLVTMRTDLVLPTGTRI